MRETAARAFDESLMKHWAAMVRAAYAVLGSVHEAEECAAASIAQVIERPPEHVLNLEAFLVTVAKRRALDAARVRQRERSRDARCAVLASGPAPDPAEDVAARAEATWVAQEARRLLSAQAYQLLIRAAEGTPARQIAEETGLTERAVESHLLRARRTLRHVVTRVGAGLGVLGLVVRRGAAPAAATAPVVLAVALLVVPSQSGGARDGSPGASPGQALPHLEARGQRALQPAPGSRHALRSKHSRSEGTPAPTAAATTVTRLGGPAGTGVTLRRESSGTDEDSPVEVVQACLERITISPERIGC